MKKIGGRLERWQEIPLHVGPVWLSSRILGYCYEDPRWIDGHPVVTGFLVRKGYNMVDVESENTFWTLGKEGNATDLRLLLRWF